MSFRSPGRYSFNLWTLRTPKAILAFSSFGKGMFLFDSRLQFVLRWWWLSMGSQHGAFETPSPPPPSPRPWLFSITDPNRSPASPWLRPTFVLPCLLIMCPHVEVFEDGLTPERSGQLTCVLARCTARGRLSTHEHPQVFLGGKKAARPTFCQVSLRVSRAQIAS